MLRWGSLFELFSANPSLTFFFFFQMAWCHSSVSYHRSCYKRRARSRRHHLHAVLVSFANDYLYDGAGVPSVVICSCWVAKLSGEILRNHYLRSGFRISWLFGWRNRSLDRADIHCWPATGEANDVKQPCSCPCPVCSSNLVPHFLTVLEVSVRLLLGWVAFPSALVRIHRTDECSFDPGVWGSGQI